MSQRSVDINNLSPSVLSKFKNSRNGLLTPDGELLPVAMFDHFFELKHRSELKELIDEFEKEVDNERAIFEDNIPDGEHPEWHTFDMWESRREDELRQEILDKAYKLGWGRIAFMQKRPKPHLVELETHPDSAKTLKQYAQSVAELCDAELQVHEVKS